MQDRGHSTHWWEENKLDAEIDRRTRRQYDDNKIWRIEAVEIESILAFTRKERKNKKIYTDWKKNRYQITKYLEKRK